ncbi:SHOCT domain-containing protein [Streptomyces sp. NPDC005791]|uniref:SHOCT domain-containing protein n=1 Tax=Streptomyces TaxID=1883 RepID=UPI0020242A71|nr:SHOCT domain-containing protein [Streptomyces atroolivaceus]
MDSYVNLAYDYPVLGAFWTIMWIFLWVIWIFLLFRVITDVFRDDSMNGWAKTGWLIFTIVLPFLGVFVYLIARGKGMGKREQDHTRAKMDEMDRYIRQTVGTTGQAGEADQLAKLAEMRSRGDISDEEFRRAKEKVLHS